MTGNAGRRPSLVDGGRVLRPVNSRNDGKAPSVRGPGAILAEHLLDCEAEAIMRRMIDKAKQGDMTAMRLCLERILPPKRDRSVRFRVPIPVSAADACESLAAITTAVARGELTPAEAAALAGVVEKYVKALEAAEFERRLQVLEQADLRKAQPRGGSR